MKKTNNLSMKFKMNNQTPIIKLRVISLLLIVFMSVISVGLANAQSGVTSPTGDTGSGVTAPTGNTTQSNIFTLQNPLKVNSLGELIQSVVQIFTYLAILFAVLMFIYIGFRYVVNAAQGNASEITKLHNQLMWLIAGVAIVLGARVLIQVIINTLSTIGVSPDVTQSANNAINAISK